MEEKKNLATRKQKGKAKQGSGTEVWEGVFLFLPKSMSNKLLTRSQQVAVNIVEKQQKKNKQTKNYGNNKKSPHKSKAAPFKLKWAPLEKTVG